jgi:VanZ family protein
MFFNTMNNLSRPGERGSSSVSQRLWRYGPLLLWILFISFASTSDFSALLLWIFPNLGESRLEELHFLTRKVAHFTEYAVLAFLASRAFITSPHAFIQRYWFHLVLILIVIYPLVDEFHQSFEPTRRSSIYDSAIDFAGGLTALLIYARFGNRLTHKKPA